MADTETIRTITERNIDLLARKPSRGHLTRITRARLIEGTYCEIEEGPWKLHADMPVKAGGDERAPTPGTLGRGALASCLAIGLAGWAARRGIALESLEVEVEADFDARGELGMDDAISPGYQAIRCTIAIDSPASESELRDLVETAVRYSPYYDIFTRPQPVSRVLRVNGREL